jgi:DNA-binding NtrC family response regulator
MNTSEKQMLIKAILDLKQEVDQLKATVYGGAEPPRSLVGAGPDSIPTPVREPLPHPVQEDQEAEWQESEVHETGSLDIRKTEQDNIRRALEKHHGNRKLAAAELGISERTLYRRLSKD